MLISQHFPQFTGKKILFVVASRQNGKFFIVGDGQIEEKDSFSVEAPTYSDNEGHFETRRSRGVRGMVQKMFGGGVPREDTKEKVEKDFLKEFEEHFKKIWDDEFDEVYLFASPYVINDIPDLLSQQQQEKITQRIEGNYIKIHPFDLLKKIRKNE
jgi:hypothetical protein